MKTFLDVFNTHDWETTKLSIYAKNRFDVERALAKKTPRDLEDFKALISPVAMEYLEEMATLSHRLTQKRFGKTIQMYAPMYLSNECKNICTYCGFSLDNKIPRRTLTAPEILTEIESIKALGYEHLLIVTGEDNQHVGMDYFRKMIPVIRPHFAHISMEVQPLEMEEYAELSEMGVNTILVYQETYNRENYKKHHPKGKKSNFDYRLKTPDRIGEAGMYKIGIGALIGLEDWRTDSFFTALHLRYLETNYWQTKYSISFPRLRPFSGGLEPKVVMTDKELVQLICAFRILDEEVELSMSTREEEKFRNNVIKLGITSISAGSKTNPGGYKIDPQTLEQFEISDERSPNEIADMIRKQGYEPVWKDWDLAYEEREG